MLASPNRNGSLAMQCGIAIFAIVCSVSTTRGQVPTPVINSPVIPTDVSIPSGFAGVPIQFFDDYSWKAFIAVVWPAKAGMRGQPDTNQSVDGAGPRVFDTYKSLAETFHNDGSAPTAWNAFDPAGLNACGTATGFGDLTLASFSKFSQLGEAGLAKLTGNLVSQNSQYIRYSTGFNETTFSQILNKQWYLRANLPPTLTFLDGSVTVKAAWRVMNGVNNPKRYYTRMANVMDPTDGSCAQVEVGLIGLHIVQKTPTRPQWIWSTFEQVDNVPPAQAGAPGTFNLNDGTATPMPNSNPLQPATQALNPPPTRTPYNVTRVMPIDPSTMNTNQSYHTALTAANPTSVWQFYQLVMTQWPIHASTPTDQGVPANTFPGTGATSAFSNVALETFEQKNIVTGCMNCHNNVMQPTDFVFSLNDHAFPPLSATPNFMANSGLRSLRSLLMKVREDEQKTSRQK